MTNAEENASRFAAPAVVKRWQTYAVVAAVVFSAASIAGWIIEPDQFYRSYLLGYMFCFELTVGCLGLVMLYHLTGGSWGTVSRRILEAAMQNIWIMVPLFVPIIIGVHSLYPWSRADELAGSEHLRHIAHQYLRLSLWLPRAGLYFIVWISLVSVLMVFSRRQDREPEIPLAHTLRAISGPGAVIYLFVTLFLYTDWLMSLTPDWYSMIYGLIFNSGHGLAAVSFTVIILGLLVRHQPMSDILQPEQSQNLGKIMLTFVMVWGWWTYAQWIIYWSGNKPDEISWYLARTRGGWEYYGIAWLAVSFCIPFAFLLSRSFKRNPRSLMKLAILTLLARYMDDFWFIAPAFPDHAGHFHYSWLDAVAPVALLSIWLAVFFYKLASRPLLALHDPHVDLVLDEAYGTD